MGTSGRSVGRGGTREKLDWREVWDVGRSVMAGKGLAWALSVVCHVASHAQSRGGVAKEVSILDQSGSRCRGVGSREPSR